MAKRETDIKYTISLDEDQKKVAAAIRANQIIVINGRAGSGKTLAAAQTALDMVFKKEHDRISITRVNVETGRSLGYLPGDKDDKLSPYLQGFKDNIYKCYVDTPQKKEKIDKMFESDTINYLPIAYIRGLTINEILIVEEVQNCTIHEIKAILTRLGTNGKIIITGDFDQCDTRDGEMNGLHYLKEMSKAISEVQYFTLKNNHRSDLVGKILDWDYSRKKTSEKLASF